MKKCGNCGTEYEGNFCPECGAEYGKGYVRIKFCPWCGEKLSGEVKFCSSCGYSLRPTTHDAVIADSGAVKTVTEKVYGWANYIRIIVFALLSVLLFAFFAGSVYETALDGLFGGISVFSGGFGAIEEELTQSTSVYALLSDEELGGAMSALIAFGVLSLTCAAVTAVSVYFRNLRYKTVKSIPLSNILSYAAYIFYFIFFLFGCIIAGKINEFDEGAGLLKVGVCPILLIVFSLVFTILAIGISVGKYLLSKKRPELLRADKESFSVKAENWHKYKEEASAKKTEYKNRLNAIEKSEKSQLKTAEPTPQLQKKLSRTVKLKRVIECFSLLNYPIIIGTLLVGIVSGWQDVKVKMYLSAPNVGYGLMIAFFIFVGVLVAISCILKVKWKPLKICHSSIITLIILITMFVLAFAISGISFDSEFSGQYTIGVDVAYFSGYYVYKEEWRKSILLLVIYLVYCILEIGLSIIYLLIARRLRYKIFGTVRPSEAKESALKTEHKAEYQAHKREEYDKYLQECRNLRIKYDV